KTFVVVAALALVAIFGATALLAGNAREAAADAPPVSVTLPAPVVAVEPAQANKQAVVPAPAVLVQDPVEPEAPQDTPVFGPGMGTMRGRGSGLGTGPMWGDGTALDLVAAELGLTADALLVELQNGATIADLAAQAGTTVEAI